MFKILPSGVAVDTSKITVIDYDNGGFTQAGNYCVNVFCDSFWHKIAEFTNEDDAKNYLKKLVAELNADT